MQRVNDEEIVETILDQSLCTNDLTAAVQGKKFDLNYKWINFHFEHCIDTVEDSECATDEERKNFWAHEAGEA